MPDNRRLSLKKTTIIDADVHLQVKPAEIAEYVEEPYKSIMLKGHIGNPLPDSGWDRSMAGKIEKRQVNGPEDIHQKLCEEFHIDHPIINAFGKLGKASMTRLAVALMKGYKDLVLEKYLDDYPHFYGLISVAMQDPEAAAEEIYRVGGEKQYIGVFMDNTGPNPPLGDPRYDVVYKAAEDEGLPISYHAYDSGFIVDFPRQNAALETFFSVHVLTHPYAHMLTMTSLFEHGVPVKFPDLKFIFLEGGVTWLPYMMYRLNKIHSIRRFDTPLLEKTPEEYIRDQFYVSTQPIGEPNNQEDMRKIMEVIGFDRMMFSSDYPHFDFDHPEGLEKFLRTNIPAKDRQRVLETNAREVYGI